MLSVQSTLSISQEALAQERTGLVRLCTSLTGNPSVAEDLAQETLLEAWRNSHKFSASSSQSADEQQTHLHQWLFAIARNVCLRWGRAHHHDLANVVPFAQYASDSEEQEEDIAETLSSPFDIEVELERDELARLLDRALTLLPPVTRAVLIERYIHESPYAEIAERLGLSEEALAQRLHRGKLTLRRVLSTDLQAEATSIIPQIRKGQEQGTNIWCPMCNNARLIKYTDLSSLVGFKCPACWHIASFNRPEIWGTLQNPKAILNRQIQALGQYYWQAVDTLQSTCFLCQAPANVEIIQADDIPANQLQNFHLSTCIYLACTRCNYQEYNPLPHMTLDVPEASQFWRKHPRMHWLSAQEIDHGGVPALVSSFQSATNLARLDVIIHRTTMRVLGIYET
jgi:RNA polymerase sigma-70 factor (ECF subfamily)